MSTAGTTTYDVKLRYLVDAQKGTTNISRMDQAMRRAERSSGLLQGSVARIVAVAGAGFGLHKASEALIGFNSNMEQARVGMAGLLNMNLDGGFAVNTERANTLISGLQQRMKTVVGTTSEAVQMAGLLAQGFGSAGASVQQMEDMTVATVVGSKAMGIASDVAARDVDQAMRGMFRSVDQFTGKLLGQKGFGFQGEEGREKFNAMSAKKRFETVNAALTSDAMKEMAKAQEGTFGGVMSTFQDGMEIALGQVGLPLFKKLTNEVKSWNTWMTDNADTLQRIGQEFGDGIAKGFETVRAIAAFVIDNRETLLALAKMWIGAKVVGGGLSALNGGIQVIQGTLMGFKSLTAVMNGGGLIAALGSAGPFALALGAMAAALHMFIGVLEEKASARTRNSAEIGANGSQAARFLSRAVTANRFGKDGVASDYTKRSSEMFKNLGALKQDGSLNVEKMRELLSNSTDESRAEFAKQLQAERFGFSSSASEGAQAELLAEISRREFERMRRSYGDTFETQDAKGQAQESIDKARTDDKKNVGKDLNVNINKIEVTSDDPDRFVMGFAEIAERALRHKAIPVGALRGG